MRAGMKPELIVLILTTVALVITLAGHIAMAFILEFHSLGMLAAPVPFVLMVIAAAAVFYASRADKSSH
ncbi:hypothetical protein L2725_11980 [Shewanella corallii]|uniref:DUF3955 domain-containing protein n=1 Tax=Shewanella corallii TaxID=560080 RepID=A0ABT0N7Q0_9GAMM|nr:hypothetical protein [Shewanella corallii]MCL2914484.1 hypothetical protein [Shewanella corallii]